MGSGLVVVTSPSLEPLTDDLAALVSVAPTDPFASELVIVPNIGVRDWLQRELSGRLGAGRAGIVANVRFVFVQQFLDMVFEASGSTSIEVWDIDHLTWVVHRAIDRIGRAGVPGAASKPLTVARVIADLFDRYGVHRPSMLRYWRNGAAIDAVEPLQDLPDHLRWQQRLFAEVCHIIGIESPADRLAALGERVRESGLSDIIPDRLSLFGFSSVNATVRTVLDVVATARQCHVHLLHPLDVGDDSRSLIGDRLVPRDHVTETEVRNPLLIRWGRSAHETSRVLGGRWMSCEAKSTPVQTDLARLRRSIVEDRPLNLAPITEESPQLESSDGSLQVHTCHGRVRQVEVLRDALLHLLTDDPTLTLDDISIQCPDLVSFAPIIPAIFRSGQHAATDATPPLDVSIADRVLTGDNPYHDAFWSILELAHSRCSVADVMSLLATAPMRRRFDVDDEAINRLADWFDGLHVRFGLDTEHRRRWNLPESIDVGTWDFALDRLFMGLALPAPEPFAGPGGVVPHDDVSVTDGPMLERVGDFLVLFRDLVSRLDSPHSVEEWSDIFTWVITEFFVESDDRDYSCRDLIDACGRLQQAAGRAGIDRSEAFAFDEVSSILADLVITSATRPRFRTGAITVTELLPQQGVPYRVIALLGVNESMFASGGVRGDDVLALRPCIGDPMPAMSGRSQLLHVLLAAKDSVIITCDGADINNNKPIPLPIPLQELLEAVAALRAESTPSGTVQVLTRHPRQNFAPRALTRGHFRTDREFTFDPVALELHARKFRTPAPVLGARGGVVDVSDSKLTSDALRGVLAKPAEFFVEDVLGIRLPSSDVGVANDFVDFWPSSLDISRAGRTMLDAVKRTPSDPLETLNRIAHQMSLDGSFPPGLLGDSAALQIVQEVLSILALVPDSVRATDDYRTIDLTDVETPGEIGERALVGRIGDIVGADLVRVSFTRFREDSVLGPWIDLALAGCVDPDTDWCVRMVARGAKGKVESRSFTLAGADADERRRSAERAIGVASTLISCMGRGRVPFLSRTSEKLSKSSIEASRSTYEKEGEYSTATQFLFGRVSWDDFIAEKPADHDPDPEATSRAQMFSHFVWNAFRETTAPARLPWGAS